MSLSTAGIEVKSSHRVVRDGVELVSSMRFAISLLSILAVASIIGTVLKQSDPYPNYVNQFGPFWAAIFRTLDFYTVYSAWWFLLILAFLLISTTLCLVRNTPKMLSDIRSWKDQVREGSLRAFGNKGEFPSTMPRQDVVARLTELVGRSRYRWVTRDKDGATLIAAKAGAVNKIGYIFAHSAIVIICLGGLLDSNLLIRAQMWAQGKSLVQGDAVISQISAKHRLSASNPAFRGYAFVPEGSDTSAAILNFQNGSLVQDLPFTIHLKKFHVAYYSTGMPKLFASDIVVIDPKTGKRIDATVEVNHPFSYKGVEIYQSSFQDGGSKLKLTGYPMAGQSAASFALAGEVGGQASLSPAEADKTVGDDVEFTDFRAINVEDMSDAGGQRDTRGVARSNLRRDLERQLGAGVKLGLNKDLQNVGPSVQYKIRDRDGQAREYNNYMLPVALEGGERVFLSGMRDTPDGPFRYLRIPADDDGTVKQWMLLRAALADPAARATAARQFAVSALQQNDSPQLQNQLELSAKRALDLFAGAQQSNNSKAPAGGFQAIADFVSASVPAAQQKKAADLLLRMLDGAIWQLWQVARQQAGQPPATATPEHARFIRTAINALSDNFYYGAPVYLQLDSFQQVQASVFQLTRSPGKTVVFTGSLLLVLGIFSMFYIRERRLWIWVKDMPDGGSNILFAVSTSRKTLDFEKEFAQLRDRIHKIVSPPPR
ncbi:cytochrome C biogenesis protein ResB [Pandoraea thiooxydans]|uniref:Cytochrome C biogenesis protein ResB n=1 Tax=Pandoraea thiooxydans TaxID=445709 RepID=A0A0G3ES91_9BURK|nr:cytochrome c biogenesis protein ResB [Pandoraea thiooxydans]AKJ69850.1 cytochrome C biogenesis protein ResB [Pandoraea thiooxydans]